MMMGRGFSGVKEGLSGLGEDIENGYGEYGAEDQSAYEGAVRHGCVIKRGRSTGLNRWV
jgi:hypothetical protein